MKKAQSQFLSFVMILAVVIGLAVFVSGWAKTLTREQAQETKSQISTKIKCDNGGIWMKSVSWVNGSLSLNIKNTGTVSLEDIRAVLRFNNSVSTVNLSIGLLSPSSEKTATVSTSQPEEVIVVTECSSVKDIKSCC